MPRFIRSEHTRGGRTYPGITRLVRTRQTARRGGFTGNHHNPRRVRIAEDLHPFSTVEVQVRPAGFAQLGGIRVFPEATSTSTSASAPVIVLYCYEDRDPSYRRARYFVPPRDPRLPSGWREVHYHRGFELITGINVSRVPLTDPDFEELDQCAERGWFPNERGVVVDRIPEWIVDSEHNSDTSVIVGDTEDTATTFIPLVDSGDSSQ
jgi:hypothetical protein